MSWYKDGYFWRKHSPDWEMKKYGFDVNGKGDLIFNTMNKIIMDKDRSDWAHDAHYMCKLLLMDGKRWPGRMNHKYDAKTMREYRKSKRASNHKLYRPQHNMTRDPYIAWMRACIDLDQRHMIEDVKIPIKLFMPNVWAWRNYLITCDEKYNRRYKFWELFSINEPDYAQHLTELMEGIVLFDGQFFPRGSRITSDESGRLVVASPDTPEDLIVVIVS